MPVPSNPHSAVNAIAAGAGKMLPAIFAGVAAKAAPLVERDQLGFPQTKDVSKLSDGFKNALAQSQQRFPVSSEAEAYLHKWGNDPVKARRYITDDIRSYDGRHPELHRIHSELMDPRLDAVYASRKKASSESIALEKALDMADRSHRLNMVVGQERIPDAEHKVYHGSPDQFQTIRRPV